MALISLTLFSACCTLLTVVGVVFFNVPLMLVLQIYLEFCAVLVFLGLILSLILPIRISGQKTRTRVSEDSLTKATQSSRDADNSQAPLDASIGYTRLISDYQQLEPIQSAVDKYER